MEETLIDGQDIRIILKSAFELRKSKNASYSINAFARDLSMNQGYLSNIINGKRLPTPKVAYNLGVFLGLEKAKILDLVARTI